MLGLVGLCGRRLIIQGVLILMVGMYMAFLGWFQLAARAIK